MMPWWPFMKRRTHSERQKKIDALHVEVSSERDKLYSNLFQLDKVTNDLDAMVKRSLLLLENKK
jgi:hypothetical protein